MKSFDDIVLEHVSHEQNTWADALYKLANDKRPNYDSIIRHVLYRPCFENEIFQVTEIQESSWMQPIIKYLTTQSDDSI